MVRRVRRKGSDGAVVTRSSKKEPRPEHGPPSSVGICELQDSCSIVNDVAASDWMRLPEDALVRVFSCLGFRDIARLACVSRAWRALSASPSLWSSLDVRAYTINMEVASALSKRCQSLRTLRIRGGAAANAAIHLRAQNLQNLQGDACMDLIDAGFSMLVACHQHLQSLQLMDCNKISSDAIRLAATCARSLSVLRLSGLHEVDFDALTALGQNCPHLTEVALLDCRFIGEKGFSSMKQLSRLSVAGSGVHWQMAVEAWAQMPNLVALDVSRSDIVPFAATRLLSAPHLKVLCALQCYYLESAPESVVYNSRAKCLVAEFADAGHGLASYFQARERALADGDTCHPRRCGAGSSSGSSLPGMHASGVRVRGQALANLSVNGNVAKALAAEGGISILAELAKSPNKWVMEEAAGGLWNLSVGEEHKGLQERAAGALWGLSVSETNSIAIGREGGVAPLVVLAQSLHEDVHETAAGALWNLAFNPGNAVRIVEERGVAALVRLCRSSRSKMARFMAALALAYMFDGCRTDEYLCASSEHDSARLMAAGRAQALPSINQFIASFTDAAAVQLASSPVTQSALQAALGRRFVAMLRNPSPILCACAAFALLQFTMPNGRHVAHHAALLGKADASRALRSSAASLKGPTEAKIFARVVLLNLQQCAAAAAAAAAAAVAAASPAKQGAAAGT
eukprot:jgi/Mesen1/1632/ME000135S00627